MTATAAPVADQRWPAVLARNSAADGAFVYAVRTTGVYCRPSCPSRTARPENVSFFPTCAEAEQAGYRPCKRCKPNAASRRERDAAIVTRACRLIETASETPGLENLATSVGLSAFHLHRLFKATVGVTPKQYGAAIRARRVRHELATAESVTEAIYDAGFSSSSRFYETANARLGMTPTAYRNGGDRTEIRFAVGNCAIGVVLAAQSDKGICAILLGDDPDELVRDLQIRFPKAILIGGDELFEAVVSKVVGLVDTPAVGLDLPLDVRGTAFQQRVWQALSDIPVGSTASYADIARRIGAPKAVRAVAQACAANTIAVAIPCHRVVRTDGSLSGYRWGVERKQVLIEKEKAPAAPQVPEAMGS